MIKTLIIGFIVAILLGLLAYFIASIVPFLKGREQAVGLGVFVVVALLYALSATQTLG